jgi:hypothetical protein
VQIGFYQQDAVAHRGHGPGQPRRDRGLAVPGRGARDQQRAQPTVDIEEAQVRAQRPESLGARTVFERLGAPETAGLGHSREYRQAVELLQLLDAAHALVDAVAHHGRAHTDDHAQQQAQRQVAPQIGGRGLRGHARPLYQLGLTGLQPLREPQIVQTAPQLLARSSSELPWRQAGQPFLHQHHRDLQLLSVGVPAKLDIGVPVVVGQGGGHVGIGVPTLDLDEVALGAGGDQHAVRDLLRRDRGRLGAAVEHAGPRGRRWPGA